jgi:PAS domain S-box-containing protein
MGNGEVIELTCIARDITARKQTENALKESEERYRSLVDNLICGIIIMQEGKIAYINNWLVEQSGFTREELLGQPFDFFVHPDDKELSVTAVARRFDGDASIRPPLRVLTKNGDIRWTEALGTVIEYKGKPAVLSCIIDITERMKAEDALHETEEKYRSLFEETKDIVLISTPGGKFIDINPAGVEFYGYSSKDELLSSLDVRDTYADPGDRVKLLDAISKQGFVKDYELLLKRKNGQQRVALVTATAERDDEGTVLAFRAILRDITEAKQLQQQFFQAQKMESIGTLAGGIAHDFNNILGGILGYASYMKTKMKEGEPYYKYIDIIEKSSEHAAELTAKLLAFARGGKYDIKPLNLNKLIGETLQIIMRTFDKSIDVETHLHDPLPTVEADASQLQQVLMNLCVNAADAMPTGGRLIIETTVETLADEYIRSNAGAKAASYVRLSVTDTGIGMDEETRKRIFEPFFTTKEEGKGTGLGLAMVYGVVKNHGGFVHVYSEPGHGTTFRIHVPASGKPERREIAASESLCGGNELILVVDDEEQIRLLSKEMLESFGYQTLLAGNGEEAIEIYGERKDEIGLVILDMVMPKMGGHETYLKMRAINPDAKVLLSTGYSQKGKAQDILDSGVMGFIQKPYRLNALLSKVRSILDVKA